MNNKQVDKILITEYNSVDDMYDEAYETISEDFDEDLVELEDELHEIIDELYYNIPQIYDEDDLKHYWLANGWTLDRGYGGPNYKERLAEEIDWTLLFDYILYGTEAEPTFDAVLITPTKLNDLVIFGEFDYEEDKEVFYIIHHQLAEHGDFPDRQYTLEDDLGNPVEDFDGDVYFEYYEDAVDYIENVLDGVVGKDLNENTLNEDRIYIYEVGGKVVGVIDEELENFAKANNVEIKDEGYVVQFIGLYDDLLLLHDKFFYEYEMKLKYRLDENILKENENEEELRKVIFNWAREDWEVGKPFNSDDFDYFRRLALDDGYIVNEEHFDLYFEYYDELREED